jgi:probable rRNA maturation factor
MDKVTELAINITNNQTIYIIIDDDAWKNVDFNLLEVTKSAIENTLSYIDYFKSVKTICCTIKLSDDKYLKKLNKAFLNKNYPTNVLSFPAYDLSDTSLKLLQNENGIVYIGDIAISFTRIKEESDDQGKSFKNHYTHLIVHGILHLLGYDHIKEKDAKTMENIEIRTLLSMGVPNPYDLTE